MSVFKYSESCTTSFCNFESKLLMFTCIVVLQALHTVSLSLGQQGYGKHQVCDVTICNCKIAFIVRFKPCQETCCFPEHETILVAFLVPGN